MKGSKCIYINKYKYMNIILLPACIYNTVTTHTITKKIHFIIFPIFFEVEMEINPGRPRRDPEPKRMEPHPVVPASGPALLP